MDLEEDLNFFKEKVPFMQREIWLAKQKVLGKK